MEMYNLGIINGMEVKENGNVVIAPKSKLTAEQAITMVMRMYEKQSETSETFADKMNSPIPEDADYMFSPFSVKTALMMSDNGFNPEKALERCGV